MPTQPSHTAARRAWPGALLLLVGLAGTPLGAQVRQAPHLSLDGARRALGGAEQEAARLARTVCIAVTDTGGEVIALARHDGVLPAFCDVARAKARTAARYGRSSRAWAELLGRGNAGGLGDVPGMLAVDGGAPILADRVLVGAIGVSGASAAEDGQVAQAGADALSAPLAARPASAAPAGRPPT